MILLVGLADGTSFAASSNRPSSEDRRAIIQPNVTAIHLAAPQQRHALTSRLPTFHPGSIVSPVATFRIPVRNHGPNPPIITGSVNWIRNPAALTGTGLIHRR